MALAGLVVVTDTVPIRIHIGALAAGVVTETIAVRIYVIAPASGPRRKGGSYAHG